MDQGCGPSCKYKHIPEIWKETKYSNRHLVSNHGRVKTKVTGRILKAKPKPYVRIISSRCL